MTDQDDDTYAASLRPPGESVPPTGPAEVTDEEIAPDPAPAGDDAGLTEPAGRAGYDPEAVSGDTEVYRPDR